MQEESPTHPTLLHSVARSLTLRSVIQTHLSAPSHPYFVGFLLNPTAFWKALGQAGTGVKAAGGLVWILSTSFLVAVAPLAIEIDKEQQILESV